MAAPITQPPSAERTAIAARPEDIDRSCRWPVLLLLGSAVLWLMLWSLFAVLVQIKLHGSFLTGSPWLAYGRLAAAQEGMFLYGFASQAALAVSIWLMARLGGTPLTGGALAIAGSSIWNTGVLLGVVGILAGDATGFEWFQFPSYAAPVLFVAYLAISSPAAMTFIVRRERSTSISQWLIFAGLLAFPWIDATANLLLIFYPVRGAMQAAVAYWFAQNFMFLWLGSIALAAIFHLVTSSMQKPVYSPKLAVAAFWMFLLVCGWGGIPFGARLPAWMPGVSTVANVLMLIPVFAFAVNWHFTARSNLWPALKANLSLWFTAFAAIAYILGNLVKAVLGSPLAGEKLEFSLFAPGLQQLLFYGFFTMAIFAAIYDMVPRLTGEKWKSAWSKVHFLGGAVGVLLLVTGLMAGGIVQGSWQSTANVEFVKSIKAAIPFVGIATLGTVLLFVGHLALLTGFISVLARATGWCNGGKEAR